MRQQAESDLKRATDLFQQKILSQSEYDGAQSKFRVADAAATEAKTLLGYTRVTAPFDGVITRKYADVGDLAAPGKPLLEMEDARDLRLEADVPEAVIGHLALGDKLGVSVSGADQRTRRRRQRNRAVRRSRQPHVSRQAGFAARARLARRTVRPRGRAGGRNFRAARARFGRVAARRNGTGVRRGERPRAIAHRQNRQAHRRRSGTGFRRGCGRTSGHRWRGEPDGRTTCHASSRENRV